MPTMTLEQAQEQILELQGQLTEARNERDTLSQNNENLSRELEQVRTLNQKYFNQLSAQYSPQNDNNNDKDEEVKTCEEFAKSIKI